MMYKRVLVRGGGDLASGVVACLHRAGWQVLVSELPEPLVVRRKVAFAEAVYEGVVDVEGIKAFYVERTEAIKEVFNKGAVAVFVDPELTILEEMSFFAIVDARMLKKKFTADNPRHLPVIGLGPGFESGVNCLVAIETNRGPNLGKAIWRGKPEADTHQPAIVNGYSLERVLFAPCDGVIRHYVDIGAFVAKGQAMASVDNIDVHAKIDGVVRGLLREGVFIKAGTKIADIDPRNDVENCYKISDKAIIIGQTAFAVLDDLYTEMREQT